MPNTQCFLCQKNVPLLTKSPQPNQSELPGEQAEAPFDGASFLREYAGQIWGINAKGFLALFWRYAAMLLFMGREKKNNGGHFFKSHKNLAIIIHQ